MTTWFLKKYALKNLIDIPNKRSSHSVPTSSGGGVAIAIVFLAGLIFAQVQFQIEYNIFVALFI